MSATVLRLESTTPDELLLFRLLARVAMATVDSSRARNLAFGIGSVVSGNAAPDEAYAVYKAKMRQVPAKRRTKTPPVPEVSWAAEARAEWEVQP